MATPSKILLADDEDTFRLSTAEILRQQGYDCDEAKDASTATQRLQESPYDLLISDIKMPGNLDLEMVRGLYTSNAHLPVILVTGYPSIRTAVVAVQLRVMAYLIKPVNVEEMLERVRNALDHSRVLRAVRNARQRLATFSNELRVVESLMTQNNPEGAHETLRTFYLVSLHSIENGLMDLKQIMNFLLQCWDKSDLEKLFESSNPIILMGALKETIEVLHQTKSSFKSKVLGKLRQRLEDLLERQPPPPSALP